MIKVSFGLIVLNADFFLEQVLKSIYPFAHKICIAEGAVTWWQRQGVNGSSDKTLEIIRNFPDPENKIIAISGTYKEKDDQCRAWFDLVPDDTDYVFCVDADEIHYDYQKIFDYLEVYQPTSLGFRSDTFYGGFERIISGFEQDHSFKRVLKYEKGCHYKTHRQPTLAVNSREIKGKDITGTELYQQTGITMWHGSYVSPKGVYEKIKYYEGAVISKGNCIPNYFKDVYLEWVLHPEHREAVEARYKGVQEFMPKARGEAYTIPFTGVHPKVIQDSMPELLAKFEEQLNSYKNGM